jgi:hypothetical protein
MVKAGLVAAQALSGLWAALLWLATQQRTALASFLTGIPQITENVLNAYHRSPAATSAN